MSILEELELMMYGFPSLLPKESQRKFPFPNEGDDVVFKHV